MTDPATHTVLAGLLAAVLVEPEDDAPRLVPADWLQEYGDEADALRGEFIRVQVELAKPHTSRRGYRRGGGARAAKALDDALRRRETGLLLEHGTGWLAAAFPGVYSEFVIPNTPRELGENRLGWGAGPVRLLVGFRRGFVEVVTCTAAAWLASAAAILAAQPVTAVTLTTDPTTAETGWLDVTTYADGYDRVYFNERWKRVKFVLSRAARS